MNNYDLSILIPSRNEEFLVRTIEDILSNIEGNTEIIAVLDGWDRELPVMPTHERLRVITNTESKGQREATNQACKLSTAKYIMKCDAHCAFDKGFDVKMMADMQDDWTMVPVMRNLHAFNWKCKNGHTRYQGPSGVCKDCGEPTEKDVVWIAKTNPQSTSYCFDEEPHFQYFNDYKRRPNGDPDKNGGLTDSMSIQGSCFMLTRDKYWELNISDHEAFGSWGSQGIEVACKTWLSGGRVVINHHTWYAHMFRTQGGDFGFPYDNPGRRIDRAKKYAKELFFDNKWHLQTRPLSWMIERFWPIPGWSEEMRAKVKAWPLPATSIKAPKDLTVGVLYYTDNELEEGFAKRVRDQIKDSVGDAKIVSVSLKPIDFGQNIVFNAERGKLTMHKQILAGLEALDTDIVFFVEHDVLYHPSHFKFRPTEKNVYYYNMNLWRVRQSDGFAVKFDHKSLSQMCGFREKLLQEYGNRVNAIERRGFNRHGTKGYEPGTRNIKHGGFSDDIAEGYLSEYPNIDVRHDKNLSASKWRPEDFHDKRTCQNWVNSTVDRIEGWEDLLDKIS